jgi:hypothetical protein
MTAARSEGIQFPLPRPGLVMRGEDGRGRISSAPPLRRPSDGCVAANLVLGASNRPAARGASRSAHQGDSSSIEPPTGSIWALYTRESAGRAVGNAEY